MSEPSGFPDIFPTSPRRDGTNNTAQQWESDLLGRLQQPMQPTPEPAGFPLGTPTQPPPSAPQPQSLTHATPPPQPADDIQEQAQEQIPFSPSRPSASPSRPSPSQWPHEDDPSTPTLRDHPDYARLSKRHALPGWRRFLSWFTRIFRSDDVASRVTRAATGAQRPVTTGRRVVVIGASGGVGTTSIATGLARTLTAVRNAPVALMAIDEGDDLASRLDVPSISPARSDLPAADFAGQLSTMTESGRVAAIRPHEDAAAMARGLGRFFAVTVVDAGRHPSTQLTTEAHAVVIVASANAAGATAATRTAAELRSAGVRDEAVMTVLLPRLPGDETARHARFLREAGITTFALPHDRHLAGGAALHLRLAAENTQVVLGELAAAIMIPAGR